MKALASLPKEISPAAPPQPSSKRFSLLLGTEAEALSPPLPTTTVETTTAETTTGEAATANATVVEATTVETTTAETTADEATTVATTTGQAATSETTTPETTAGQAATSETTTAATTTGEATTAETTTVEALTEKIQASPRAEPGPVDESPGQAGVMAPAFSFYGLYPLWEGTGNMLGHRRVFMGNNWFGVGFAQRFSLGLRPTSFFFRAPNVDFKALLYARDNLKVSMQLAPSLILPGASKSFTTTNFVSRFDDNNHHLWLLPLSAHASWKLFEELSLHASLTALGAFGKQVPNAQFSVGLTVFAEFIAWDNHSLRLHLGEIGFWHHDFAMLGASYRLHWEWLEIQVGYFYRLTPDGNQGGALIALGVLL